MHNFINSIKLTAMLFLVGLVAPCCLASCSASYCQSIHSTRIKRVGSANTHFEPGDQVEVIDGPYQNQVGEVTEVFNASSTLMAKLRSGDVHTFDFSDVERVDSVGVNQIK
jgi:hypothetical protein